LPIELRQRRDRPVLYAGIGMLSSAFPAGAARRVFDDDSGGGELIADRVGGGEVAVAAGLLTCGDALFDPALELGIVVGGASTGEVEDADHLIDAEESISCVLEVRGGGGTECIERRVGSAHEGEERAEACGHVEIVVEGGFELAERLVRDIGE